METGISKNSKWTLYDLQDKLKQGGWMVPAYTLPENIQNYIVMRIVVRQGFSRDMADMLLNDINNAIAGARKLEYPTPTRIAQEKISRSKALYSLIQAQAGKRNNKYKNSRELF